MKTTLALIAVAAVLLSSCSSPFAPPDQLDIGIAQAAMQQPAHAAEVSRAMAMRSGAPVTMRLQPLAPLQPLQR